MKRRRNRGYEQKNSGLLPVWMFSSAHLLLLQSYIFEANESDGVAGALGISAFSTFKKLTEMSVWEAGSLVYRSDIQKQSTGYFGAL